MPVSVILFIVSLLGAVSGYLRELSLAATFGAGRYTDAYFVAASIPMVIGDLLIGSALLASIVPIFSKLNSDTPDQHNHRATLFNALLAVVLMIAMILAAIAFGIMPALIHFLA